MDYITVFLSFVLVLALLTKLDDGKRLLPTKVVHGDVRFFAIGDWGGRKDDDYQTVPQKHCAHQFDEELGPKLKPHFFVSTGDNIYPKGVNDSSDPRFELTFNSVFKYGKDELNPANSILWYMIGGNHDHHGNITGQLEYSEKNPRWVMPDLFYSVTYKSLDTHVTVKLVFVDTIVLAGNTPKKDESTKREIDKKTGKKPTRNPEDEMPVGLEKATEAERTAASDALHWIKEQLTTTDADYVFVIGHYPIISFTPNGASKHMAGLEKVIVEAKVTAYVCGHEHSLQHTMAHGIHHIVTGGGHLLRANYEKKWHDSSTGYTDNYFYPPEGMDKDIAGALGGFVYFNLGKGKGGVTYFNSEGATLKHFTIHPRSVKK